MAKVLFSFYHWWEKRDVKSLTGICVCVCLSVYASIFEIWWDPLRSDFLNGNIKSFFLLVWFFFQVLMAIFHSNENKNIMKAR